MKHSLENLTETISKTYNTIKEAVTYPYNLYKNNRYINMNVNVLAAAFPSITAAGLVSYYCKTQGLGDLENSIITAATDWGAYIPVHVGFQYYSNKEKFRDDKGHVNIKAFTKDMLKIYKTYIPSIALFYVIAGPIHNLCLKLGMDGDSATNTSYWGTMVITRALHTYTLWRADKKDKLK